VFGRPLCQLWLAVDYTASTASILNLLILSLDRYWSVSNPLLYLPKRTKNRARFMIFLVWVTSGLWLIPIFSWHRLVNGGVYTIPEMECDPEYKESFPLKVVTGIFNFFIPLFVMYFLYGRIFLEIRKRSDLEKFQSMRRNGGRHTGGGSRCCRDELESTTIANGGCSGSPRNSPVVTQDLPAAALDCSDSTAAAASSTVLEPLLPASSAARSEAGEPSAAGQLADGHAQYIYDEMIVDRTTERVQLLLLREPCNRIRGSESCSRCMDSIDQAGASIGVAATVPVEAAPASGTQQRRIQFTLEAAVSEPSKQTKPNENRSSKSRFKLSNSLKKEIKAAKQLGVIMGAFTACFMPYFVIFVVVAFCPDCVSSELMLALTWVGYANSALNPILYPLCNHAFRRKFRHMLSCLLRSD
uniref:G_PROTEIN_RECEP_F1_2 domain-containing protein n=1 Tax=Macrostomum lignano TaxID=282301 RepID=A0A1I8G1H7_9PLAT